MATEDIKEYIVSFNEAVRNGDPAQVSTHYDNWNKLTEKYYKQSEWPTPESIATLVQESVFAWERFLM